MLCGKNGVVCVRCDDGSGGEFESVVWQSNGSEKLGALGDVAAHDGVFLVHGSLRFHYARRARLWQRCERFAESSLEKKNRGTGSSLHVALLLPLEVFVVMLHGL